MTPVAAAEALVAGETAAAGPVEERTLVIVGLDGAPPEALAAALGLSAYEASQRSRRGGYHLHCALPAADAAGAADGLRARGLVVFTVDAAAARAAADPELALGGRFADGVLIARTPGGSAEVAAGDVVLLVKGPIARERPASDDRLHLAPTATLEPGSRFHLHRRGRPRPLEIDPSAFDFDAPRATASSLIEIGDWMARLSAEAPVDDSFRRMAPALAPEAPAAGSAGRAEDALRRGAPRKDAILDNLAQFRFFSAWRGAVARLAGR